MINETTLSVVLFKWAVFCLLVYKCYQLVKQYAIPWLCASIKQEQNQLTELINRDKLAMLTKQKIEHQIHQQTQLLATIETKVHRWHVALLAEKKAFEEDQRQLALQQQAKHAAQQQHLFLAQTIQATIPLALEQAQADLTQRFADINNDHSHLDRLIISLQSAKSRHGR